jgi:hypothetical protein
VIGVINHTNSVLHRRRVITFSKWLFKKYFYYVFDNIIYYSLDWWKHGCFLFMHASHIPSGLYLLMYVDDCITNYLSGGWTTLFASEWFTRPPIKPFYYLLTLVFHKPVTTFLGGLFTARTYWLTSSYILLNLDPQFLIIFLVVICLTNTDIGTGGL